MLNLTWEKEILDINNIKGNFSKSNKAYIKGVIEDELEFSHKAHGEKFYKTRVEVKRDSGVADYIPVLISEREMDLKPLVYAFDVKEIDGKPAFYLNVCTGSVDNIKPELVLASIYEKLGLEYNESAIAIHRIDTYTTDEKTGKLVSLLNIGNTIY